MSRTFKVEQEVQTRRRADRARRDRRRAKTEIIALSYSGDPQPILYGPNAGKLARVGIDEHGRFRIVPVDRIVERVR